MKDPTCLADIIGEHANQAPGVDDLILRAQMKRDRILWQISVPDLQDQDWPSLPEGLIAPVESRLCDYLWRLLFLTCVAWTFLCCFTTQCSQTIFDTTTNHTVVGFVPSSFQCNHKHETAQASPYLFKHVSRFVFEKCWTCEFQEFASIYSCFFFRALKFHCKFSAKYCKIAGKNSLKLFTGILQYCIFVTTPFEEIIMLLFCLHIWYILFPEHAIVPSTVFFLY